MLKVAVFNFKGGTGKSTTALNLGASLASSKRRVVLVDLDGQRTLSFGLGFDGAAPTSLDWLNGEGKAEPIVTRTNANLYLLPGDLGLFQLSPDRDVFGPALSRLSGFDLCLMDCAPSLGPVSVQAILSSDRILMPVVCEPAVLKGLSEAIELIRRDRPDVPIDVVRVRYRSRLSLSKEASALLSESAGEQYRLLETTIPENIAIAESIAHQQPITVYAMRSTGAKSFHKLAKEYAEILA